MAEETAREEIPVSHYSTHRATPEVPARSKMQLTLAQTESKWIYVIRLAAVRLNKIFRIDATIL